VPAVTLVLALIIFGSGVAAGGVGALLGIGGGVFFVPLLHVALGFPLRTAAAVSLTTVIATSSSVSAGRAGEQLINLRLGMVLEVATVAGSLLGGLTAHFFSETTLQRLFGVVTLLAACAVLARVNRRNVLLDPAVDPGQLGGRFHEDESGAPSRIASSGCRSRCSRRSPRATCGRRCSASAAACSRCRAEYLVRHSGAGAAATSAFMIGVTATGGAIIYYGRGDLPVLAAAPAILGVQLDPGSGCGSPIACRRSG
jgi:uncharacterized membrane protein YfcA